MSGFKHTVALSFLLALPVQGESYRPAWSDADRDGFNTREELILAQCPVVQLTQDRKGIKCAEGQEDCRRKWLDIRPGSVYSVVTERRDRRDEPQ